MGGLSVDDIVYVSPDRCSDDFTSPTPSGTPLVYVPGGEPVVITNDHRVDVGKFTCGGTLSPLVEGRGLFGYVLRFTLREVSPPGQFHQVGRSVGLSVCLSVFLVRVFCGHGLLCTPVCV